MLKLLTITFFIIGSNLFALNKDKFFNSNKMYLFDIVNWPESKLNLTAFKDKVIYEQSQLNIYQIDSQRHVGCDVKNNGSKKIFTSTNPFSLRTSGNKTNQTPKSSYKIKLSKSNKFLKMRTINLKSMWNDPSQMRESIVWELFNSSLADLPAPRHTYAKFCVNGSYYGLYSVIEQIDKIFLKEEFGSLKSKGNLYKAYWGQDLGQANLSYIAPAPMQINGEQYHPNSLLEDKTYRLKTNTDEINYSDLATFIEIINKSKNDTIFELNILKSFEVYKFLRWAAINQMVGGWDNYLRTGGNFYLYNLKNKNNPKFTWIPWDYDNSLGIFYRSGNINKDWQYHSPLVWEIENKLSYKRPLITNLLSIPKFKNYYLTFMRNFLINEFNLIKISEKIKKNFNHIKNAVYQEASSPHEPPFTMRQFTNDQIYKHGFEQEELYFKPSNMFAFGIKHWTIMRYDYLNNYLTKLGY